jgi:hypothetical protein
MFLLAGDPHSIPTATGDPFKTLFVARIVSVDIDVGILHAPDQLIHILVMQMMLVTAWALFFFQNYDSSESKLRREFEVYGPIKKVRIYRVTESTLVDS